VEEGTERAKSQLFALSVFFASPLFSFERGSVSKYVLTSGSNERRRSYKCVPTSSDIMERALIHAREWRRFAFLIDRKALPASVNFHQRPSPAAMKARGNT